MVEDQRAKQKAHGAQSDQGGGPYKPDDAPETQPAAYEGPEESNQQRRYADPGPARRREEREETDQG